MMDRWVPRGTRLRSLSLVAKLAAAHDCWQIYTTDRASFLLAATEDACGAWRDRFALPENLLYRDAALPALWLFEGKANYLIASTTDGPYPSDSMQIEAFSHAFKAAVDQYPGVSLAHAVYIEEYSLILPVDSSGADADEKVVYAQWLTGGVEVSIDDIGRVGALMSWLPRQALFRSAALAGFSPGEQAAEAQTAAQSATRAPFQRISRLGTESGGFKLTGRPQLERFFIENIIEIVDNPERYRRMGIAHPGATILHGPPGCGKTYAVDKLAQYLAWPRFDIDSKSIASSYIHDTSKRIAEVFSKAIEAAPSLVVIDEMEAFLTSRNRASASSTNHVEEVSEFLRRIPEAVSQGVLVFAMTNMLDAIDPAIVRRGRFDHIVEVSMASADEILALLIEKSGELPISKDVDLRGVAEALCQHPLSDVAFVLREAGKLAARGGKEWIDGPCVQSALNVLPKKENKPKIGF